MFSSNSSINLSSSYLHFPAVFAGYDNNEVFLNHHHDPDSDLLLPTNPRIPESLTNMAFTGSNTTMIKQDFNGLNAEYCGVSEFVPSQKPVKKDRHSKICTAKGLRDRRVRLSIEIAREFFDLQDMLGFNKASETLGWLLNKSRNAIKELEELKHTDNIGSTQHEVVYINGDLERISRSELLESISEKKQMEKLRKNALQVLAKESRDKARARARERTREKTCTRLKLHKCKKVTDTRPEIFAQFRSLSQNKTCEASSSYAHNFASSLNVVAEVKEQPWSHELANQAPMKDVSEQRSNSNVLKRKQNLSSIFGYQQNLEISKDLDCNTNCTLPQNWDMDNGAIPQYSTFHAVTTNMNLSTA